MILRLIREHWLNHKVQATVLSEDSEFIHHFDMVFRQKFYYLVECNIVDFIDVNFINKYMRRGIFAAFSVGSKIDSGNVISFINGKLYMSIDKETYQELGISAKKAKYPIRGDRWNVIIELLTPSFEPGKPLYERVLWALNNRLSKVKMIISWALNDDEGFVEEIDFPESLVTNVKKLSVEETTSILESIDIPIIEIPEEENHRQLFYDNLSDWIGCLSLKIMNFFGSSNVDPYVSQFSNLLPSTNGSGYQKYVTGIISTLEIENQYYFLRKLNKRISILSVWGFEDSNISWNKSEHSMLSSGANDYHIIFLSNDEYLIFICYGDYDQFSI